MGAITSEYGSVGDIGWYGSSYLLTSTALQPLYGKIYRIFDIKYSFLGAIALFELGSLVSAMAPSSTAFIIGRAVAGMGSAGLFSGSIVIILHSASSETTSLFGMFGCMWGIASVAGPLLGGVFTDHLTWRWGCGIDAGDHYVTSRAPVGRFSVSVERPTYYRLIAGAGAMALVFIGIEHYQQDKGLLPPRFFKDRNLLCAMLFAAFFGASFFPLIYYLSLYFQAIQGDSAVKAGIKLLPLLISVVISSIISGALITATGYYNPFILVEIAMVAVGAGLITTLDLHTPFANWFGYQVLDGLGVGVGFQASVIVVQNVVSRELVPQATSCVQFFQSLGGALFIAVAQTVFQNGLINGLARDAPHLDPGLFTHSGASQVRQVLASIGQERMLDAVLGAYMRGLRHTYYISAAAATVAFLAALGLQWKKIEKKGDGNTATAAGEIWRACTPAAEFDTYYEGAGELCAASKLQKRRRGYP
ncbi:putative HC-toxin efflux carrier TOXA [Daldinia childiae]|uniref:putative HC-toxin efflux carrier TOXA n=1 Tax=Daldinia childiae TaxID=326645 RepID=UPI001444AB5A|nr:putative HC-toxin efflux carrier TOXA [Daldinia childiae]KAF3061437.1 putative HC-toxin efflux carrier TOXA [Daldinia childiae]